MNQSVNPHRATTIGDLVTPAQLYWLDIAAESIAVDKAEQAALMFDCSLYELNKQAADTLLAYFARIKANDFTGHDHEHECVVCSNPFACNQSLCDATLRRYCDHCAVMELSGIYQTSDEERITA